MTDSFDRTLKAVWKAVRDRKTLTLCLTNFVTVNDCANALLATGASPVMSLDENDARELATIADALVLNIGTLDSDRLSAMLGAGKVARNRGIPVILDPVGAGATRVRLEASRRILEEAPPTIIRGNASEILALWGLSSGERQKGVDASGLESAIQLEEAAKGLAARHSCTVAVSGKTDLAASPDDTATFTGGSELLTRLTGTGCVLSALTGAAAGAWPGKPFEAAQAALYLMKEAGSRAEKALSAPGKIGEYRQNLFDALAETAFEFSA
jgi:hydroxyethylthiazole kinase